MCQILIRILCDIMSQPNLFQRPYNNVLDFEKKFDAIHASKVKVLKPVVLNQEILALLINPDKNQKPEYEHEPDPEPKPEYKNRVRYTIVTCGDITEYLVTLRLDNCDKLYEDVEETKVFENEQDALTCFHEMKCMRTLFPLYVLGEFQKY